MSRTILVGVDGSATALQAAEKAASLATELDAELTVMSAFSVNVTGTLHSVARQNQTQAMTRALDELTARHAEEAERVSAAAADQLRGQFPDLKITSKALEGSPGVALSREAEEQKADFIVVGNKRVHGPGKILGSIARTVANEARCDLYIVNTHPR